MPRCWREGMLLERAGYYEQVRLTASSVLLFAMRDGARQQSIAGRIEIRTGSLLSEANRSGRCLLA